jgi:hypothetical protein
MGIDELKGVFIFGTIYAGLAFILAGIFGRQIRMQENKNVTSE